MREPTYPLVPIANLLAALLVVVTAATNGSSGGHNRGVIMFQGWVLTGVLTVFLQSIIWSDTNDNIVPVLCDIISHLQIGMNTGIPACILLIMRRLWLVIGGDMELGGSKLLKETFIDYFLGIGLPMLHIGIYYIVQGARFRIVEGFGCMAAVYASGASFLLLDIWPLLLTIASTSIYSWRVVLYLQRHTRTLGGMFRGHSESDRTRHIRTLALGFSGIFFNLPVAIMTSYNIYVLSTHVPVFWPGWEEIHTDWDPILTSMPEWRNDRLSSAVIYWDQWINVVLSVAVFLLFGLTFNARTRYVKAFGKARELTAAGTVSIVSFMRTSFPSAIIRGRIPTSKMDKDSQYNFRFSTEPKLDALHMLESGTPDLVTVDLQIDLPLEVYIPGRTEPPVLVIHRPQ